MVEMINMDRLTECINKVEKAFKDCNLNATEKQLVLNCINDRWRDQLQNQKTKDMLGNIPFGGLFKKAQKDIAKEED